MNKTFIVFTCEHSSNAIPPEFLHLFKKKEKLLLTHRGFDHGTKEIGHSLGRSFKAPVVYGKYSRLLVDLNRSHFHKTTFSEMTKVLSKSQKRDVLALYHYPHWNEVKTLIGEKIKLGYTVIHIGVHSFTPVLFNEVRNADIGILYNSRRKTESRLAIEWQRALREHCDLRVRRNYPYDGKMDGLSTGMRKIFPEKNYKGFEIEINHSVLLGIQEMKVMAKLLEATLKSVLKLPKAH